MTCQGATESPSKREPNASVGPAPPSDRIALRAVSLAVGCGVAYLLIVGGFRLEFKQTDHPHHILMADALLHGQLHIRPEALQYKAQQHVTMVREFLEQRIRQTGRMLSPRDKQVLIRDQAWQKTIADWAVFDERYYGYWAPLTPVLMMPFVAFFGLGVSDQVINVLFGAVNVGLFYWLLRRVDRNRLCLTSEAGRLALTLLLAFGTAHFWLTCEGKVWGAVQIVTLTALLLSLIVACGSKMSVRRWVLSGALFGCALLARNIVGFVGLFFVTLLWLRSREASAPRTRTFLLWLGSFCIPLVGAGAVQGAYNYARFGSVFESGLDIQIRTGGNERFMADYERYGMFSARYVPRNAKYYFWNCNFPRRGGRIWFDLDGNSMFLLTPPLLYLFLIWRRWTRFTFALLCGFVPLLAVLMFYFATGFIQFGPRYLLDAMPFLLLLVATGMRGRLTHPAYALSVLAIAAHLFGTYRLCDAEFKPLQPYISMATLPILVAIAIAARVMVVWLKRRYAHAPASQRSAR